MSVVFQLHTLWIDLNLINKTYLWKIKIKKRAILGKNLTLTGMMGVGKSTIGKKLAKRLKFNFVDVDNLKERKEGMSINLKFS